ncbi:SWIM-type domain-containing protein [Citrus sinensis]|nr:SWIM-type domain-containing protein [Citrus sinensis]
MAARCCPSRGTLLHQIWCDSRRCRTRSGATGARPSHKLWCDRRAPVAQAVVRRARLYMAKSESPDIEVGKMYFRYADHFPGRISSMCMLSSVVKVIEEKLTNRQLRMFKKDIFGHFLECRSFPFSGVILHNLLLRQVAHEEDSREDQLWFQIGKHVIRLSIVEWCLVTGLSFGVDTNQKNDEMEQRLRNTYFGGVHRNLSPESWCDRVPVAPRFGATGACRTLLGATGACRTLLGATGCLSHQVLLRQAACRQIQILPSCSENNSYQLPVAAKLGATGNRRTKQGATGARRTKPWCDRHPVAPRFGRQVACRLMDSVVLELCYDGWWETLENSRMEYVNGKNRAFLVGKNYLFDQLLARVYEVLQINPNDYSITMRTTLRSSNTLYRICAMPMDICDDEMVRVVLHMASDVANFGCIPIFVTTSPRVPSEGIEPHVDTETSFRANMSGPDNDEEVLPRTISLQQYYSPIHDNYDNIDDNGVTLQDVGATVFPITTSLEQRYSPYHNNIFRDNDDFHNETEGDNHEDECEDNTPVNNRGNRPIPSMVRSRRRIDPLTSVAPTLPSNKVAPSFVSSCDSDDISVGKLFAEKNEFILQLRKVAFRDKFDFKIARSTTTRFEAHCCSESCKWRIRATRCLNEQNIPWVVKRIDNVHTCHNEVLVDGRHQVRSQVVGHIIAEKYIQDKRIYTPNDIRADMQQEYGVQLTYQQAYRARKVGLEIVRGNPAESYNLLPKYSHVLTTANEGTVTHLEQDGDGNFLYYFVALGSSIKGFMQYIRPVIAVDGTHLKGLYRGSMFVATCLDGNNQLYPLAIGIMDSENNDAWEWFMMKLHGVIGDRPELVIIFDRCTAIRRAVLKVFHNATHGVCFYHVKGNIKSPFRMSKALWDQFEPAFINAAKTYGHEEFKRQLEGLWMIHSGAADYLENNVGTCNWARSQFEGRRYSILTTNIAESVNAFMREPRKFPVTHLVDHFRKTLQQWFYDRKIVAESMTTRLTTWADEIVTERRTIAERMIVRPVSPHRFQVIGGGLKEGLVDLQKRTCSCRVFQLDQLVCAHAIAACLTHRVDFINLCSDFYTTESLAMAYAQPVEPVGDVADWEIPDEIQEMHVYPPVEAPPPGRRKELRIPSAGEDVDRRTVRCGRCHELGHNRKRCKNPIASTRS